MPLSRGILRLHVCESPLKTAVHFLNEQLFSLFTCLGARAVGMRLHKTRMEREEITDALSSWGLAEMRLGFVKLTKPLNVRWDVGIWQGDVCLHFGD